MTDMRWTTTTTALLERVGRAVIARVDDGEDTGSGGRVGGSPPAPVVLVGGMAATEPVLAPLARRLERRGHDVVTTTTDAGLGCASAAVDVLVEQILDVA